MRPWDGVELRRPGRLGPPDPPYHRTMAPRSEFSTAVVLTAVVALFAHLWMFGAVVGHVTPAAPSADAPRVAVAAGPGADGSGASGGCGMGMSECVVTDPADRASSLALTVVVLLLAGGWLAGTSRPGSQHMLVAAADPGRSTPGSLVTASVVRLE